VLVVPHTDPGWTPLFLNASALVTEVGGMLSHGAVVARELGLPAVVNVRDATRRLRDGQAVEVDGARGEVRVL
jgi:pyruvate,water dikinase